MKLNKLKKRFWTLNRHNSEGFTLVELIVVIAILAILAGVGIPVYSGYITSANKQADITLANEIEQALILAHYKGTLKKGASVIVYFDDDKAVVVDPDGDLGAAAAMTAAFGDSYSTLDLKWDGWKDMMGVAADKEMMEYVNDSNFTPENLKDLLTQVDTVVDAASGYLNTNNYSPSPEVNAYLNQAGITLEDGKVTTDEQATAAANAYVFAVADQIGKTKVNVDTEKEKFLSCWYTLEFGAMQWDNASAKAAKYAAVLAMATYIDKEAGTEFTKDLGGDHTVILTNQDAVLNKMIGSTDANVQAALTSYGLNMVETEACYKDAMAFLAYMQGVTTASESMMNNYSLTNTDYFSDGNVLSYVKDYVSISEIIPQNATNGALVFYYNGESVTCLPLDY